MFASGLDIGYGGLKLAFGTTGMTPTERHLPSGAAPAEHYPPHLDGELDKGSGFRVLVNEVPYVAGVAPSVFQSGVGRVLHADYPASAEYMALFHAALLEMGRREIDLLVTGLPVNQLLDGTGNKRKALQERLQGTHYVDGKTVVDVRRVQVLPQPVGAYLDMVETSDDLPERGSDASVLVVDPGFFSVDWVGIQNGRLRDASSGTSTKAMSYILDAAVGAIRSAEDVRVSADRLDEAIRAARPSIKLFGKDFAYETYVSAAANAAAAQVVNEIKRSLRSEFDIDVVILAGGASEYYASALHDGFPRSRLLRSNRPVMANARGFYYSWKSFAKDAKAAAAKVAAA